MLIAAAAVGLALVRGWQYPRWCSYQVGFYREQTTTAARRLVYDISVAISWTIPLGITLTIALLALRLRPPRPRLRLVVRQPGFLACACAAAAIAFRLGEESFCWILAYLTRPQSIVHLPSPPFVRFDNPGFHPPPGQWFRNALLETFPILVSPSMTLTVATAWCVLRATGHWRSAPDWVDKTGRALGCYWLALGLVLAAVMEISKLIS